MNPQPRSPEREVEVSWGLLPAQARALVRRREWDNPTNLKLRLLGEKKFPIRIALKPPSGSFAVANLAHFRQFVEQWRSFPRQDMVRWTTKTFRDLCEQSIPTALVIDSVEQMIQLLGEDAASRSNGWQRRMAPLLGWETTGQTRQCLYPVLVRHIDILERLSQQEAELIAKLLPQLAPAQGEGLYLRALPLTGVDTKLVENHYRFIEALADAAHAGAVTAAGGLLPWLGCLPHPRGLAEGVPVIYPRCDRTRAKLGGFPLVQIPSDVLRAHELPADNILVVENLQSGLALPQLPDTVAVIGGGKNIAWMDARWLAGKRVGYWGDIDTWGLSFLGAARGKCDTVEPIMMDVQTLNRHEQRMVAEPSSLNDMPAGLSDDEQDLFRDLLAGRFHATRLEQERISSDYIRAKLAAWLKI